MTPIVQVTTTVDGQPAAERIAQALVERHLAACVQIIGPIHSTYRWQGAIETSEEWMCIAKTTRPLADEVQQAISELHSYDVPEILVMEVAGGDSHYLEWIHQATRREDP